MIANKDGIQIMIHHLILLKIRLAEPNENLCGGFSAAIGGQNSLERFWERFAIQLLIERSEALVGVSSRLCVVLLHQGLHLADECLLVAGIVPKDLIRQTNQLVAFRFHRVVGNEAG